MFGGLVLWCEESVWSLERRREAWRGWILLNGAVLLNGIVVSFHLLLCGFSLLLSYCRSIE